MIGTAGVFVAVVLIIVLAFRGVNMLVASIVCALLVAAANGMPLNSALADGFTRTMMGFAGQFLILFLTGAIFGRLMAESRAAESIAYALTRALGESRAVTIVAVATSLLTYGGINAFVVMLTTYPLGLMLVRNANIPKRLLMGGVVLGAGTFTLTAMPGSPSIPNNLAANALGTSLSAAPFLGLLASAIMLTLGIAYLEWERRRAARRGERFVAGPADVIFEDTGNATAMPHWFAAAVPLIVVLAVILIPGWLAGLLPGLTRADSALAALLSFTRQQPILWTCGALSAAICCGLLLFRHRLDNMGVTIGRGAESAAQPLLNTAAVIGFGGVVSQTPLFSSFADLMLHSGLHPLLSAVISINVISGVAGSASGALGIWLPAFGQQYLELGVAPETLHRVLIVGSGAFDSMPHCGPVITCLTLMGLTHREAYKDTAIVTVLVPLIATLVIMGVAIWL